ncbi:uncharacterized protein [Antedon mediterranea]|uniref:uncharacterized protein n=1 Tax=Antedon mediterranea TaxID=105859 RepID=UPI003AF42A9C
MDQKRIKSPVLRIPLRPERYEWEEISNSPPPSTQNILKLFDTNTLVRDHPRKYKLLLAQDEGSEQAIPQTLEERRPRSSSTKLITSSPSESVRKNKSLVDLKTFFQHNSDAHVKGYSHHEALSDADAGIAKLTLDTDEQNLESTNLSAIAQKYAGFPQTTEPDGQERRFSFGIPQKLEHQQDRRVSMDDSILRKGEHSDESNKTSSMPSTSANVQKVDTQCESDDMMPVSIQPQPRRFLGIGAYFKPLPETLLVPKDNIKTSHLTEEINKRGITAARKSSDVTDCKKKVPTQAEMNMWAPSGL